MAVSSLAVINGIIIEQLKNKKYMPYDLHCLLKKHHRDIVPLLMVDESGLNMLHQCIQHRRVDFLKVLFAHGYWPDLIEQEISRGSTCEYAGCTPKQMAERKRMRQLVREIDCFTQLETSMGDKNAILRAARAGNLQLLKSMAGSRNVDVKARDSKGNNCVHWAAVSGNLDAVIYLTQELKLQSNFLNEEGQTPLHLAAIYGHKMLIAYLIQECKLDAEKVDSSGRAALQYTAENGDVASLSEVLKCNVEVDQCLGVIAAQFGRQGYLEHCLKSYGVDHKYKNVEGKTCLMVAAERGHLEIVAFLLKHYDIPLNDVSKQERSAFHYVADKGHADIAKALLEKAHAAGLLPDVLNRKDSHCIEKLCSLVRGIDQGRAAWHYVHLKRKYVHLFEKCTKGGRVDASQVGSIIQSGWGPEPDTKVLKKSLERYQSNTVTKQSCRDLSPTLLAIAKGHSEVAKLFIEAGGDVKLKDCFGQTGLHLAAMRGTLDVAVALEHCGLQMNAKDEEGDTPLDVSKANEHPQLVNFFKDQEYRAEVQMFLEKLDNVKTSLEEDHLKEIRHSGEDVTRHVISSLRDLHMDINLLLKKVGSGPILEESSSEHQTNEAVRPTPF